MKRSLFKNALLIISLLLGTQLSAADLEASLRIVKNPTGKQIQLYSDGQGTGTIQVQIKDAANVILLSESIRDKANIAKQYNLDNLPAGTYFIVVSNETEQVMQPFEIIGNTILLNYDQRESIFKPVINLNGDHLDINLLLTRASDVKVELYDQDFERLYRSNFKDFGRIFSKRLNLTQLRSGKYLLKIKFGKEVFYQTVNVE